MKAMSTLESVRLYLSALWHTINWPKTELGKACVGYVIFYFVLLWKAETFAEGIALGVWGIVVMQACLLWAQRAIKWRDTQLVQDQAHGHEPSWQERLHDHSAARLPKGRRDAKSPFSGHSLISAPGS